MNENYKLTKTEDMILIELKGNLDEDFTLKNVEVDNFKNIVIDFENVSEINSCGIREWINFRLRLKDKKITFRNCRKIIVDQMNMVHGFLGGSDDSEVEVESIYLPFYCEDCDIEETRLFNLKDIVTEAGVINLPEVKCSKCPGNMEFDEIESQFFNFLKQIKK
jgi:anti-anti-sigma regulatory factor